MLDHSQPLLLNTKEVAVILRVRPCTVANERKRGRLACTMVGAHVFHTHKHINDYLEKQEIKAECGNSTKDQDKLGPFGRAKSLGVRGKAKFGISRGTMIDKQFAKALARQTLKKPAC